MLQILGAMRKMLADQEREDIEKRQKKIQAGKRYQEELDAQLSELRMRSFNSLASKIKISFLALCTVFQNSSNGVCKILVVTFGLYNCVLMLL